MRDLAAWIIGLIERQASGIFNAAGEPVPFAAHLDTARQAAGHTGPLMASSPQWLSTRGVAQWMGSRSLPLWLDQPEVRGIGSLSNARARSAGLTLRPLNDTLADTLTWAPRDQVPTVSGAGLTDAEEQTLLAELAAA